MSVISIIEAVDADHFAQVAALLRDYRLWMRRRYCGHDAVVDYYFDDREWESELSDLAGHFGAPFGAIVLALVDGIPAGCVMTRGIGEDVCEMKRLFVRPAFQGLGLARAMAKKLARLARTRGYTEMRLETGALQREALALYASLGFTPIAPYYACPKSFEENSCFMEADLDTILSGKIAPARLTALQPIAA